MKIEIYDPPMCCSTGVCGPSVDPKLAQFAADLAWLARHGVEVERYNLAQQPAAFAESAVVREALASEGNGCLPLLLADGKVLSKGRYPNRQELAGFAGVEVEPSIFTDAVRELVAVGAAIASGCEPCFRYHYNEARKLGVSKDDMRLAVEVAQAVKIAPAQSILQLAEKYLGGRPAEASSSCCGSATEGARADSTPGKCSCC